MSKARSSVEFPPPQPSTARLQTKYTLINNNTTATSSTQIPRISSVGQNMPSRSRTTSTSSVDTIRISSYDKKKTKEGTKVPRSSSGSKKRCRASDSTSSGLDPAMLDIRRTRQRTLSSSSTATVRAGDQKSDVAFPSSEDASATDETADTKSTTLRKKGAGKTTRRISPLKLNPGHAAPSVAVAVTESVIPHRDAPSPPALPSHTRQRVNSLSPKHSQSTSQSHQTTTPPVRSFVPNRYRSSLFEPLPDHLQDWEPSTSVIQSPLDLNGTDDQTSGDEDASEAMASGGPWKDQWGNLHLGMDDLDLSITFHKKQPFFDVWDLPDDIYVGVPARVHLTVKDPHRWTGFSLAPEPDVRYIDIRCNSFEYRSYPVPAASIGRHPQTPFILPPEYAVAYTGTSSSEYSANTTAPIDLTRGIVVNKKWHKTFPGNKVFPHRERLISTYNLLPDDSIESAVGKGEGDEDHVVMRRGWYFKFLIPVPMWVVRMGNSRAFTVEVSVWAGPTGGDDHTYYYGDDFVPEGGLLRQETEMVISHLRSEEEMAKKLQNSA